MTLRDQIETTNVQPTDEGLVDYLLSESTANDAIESWLAADESHLLRLERLAEVVFAVAATSVVSEVQSTNVLVLSPLSEIDAISDSQPLNASHLTYARLLMGLAALAAAIALIVVWSRQEPDYRLTNDRLAVAWAELVSAEDSTSPLAVELPDAWPVADVDAMATDMSSDSGNAWSIDDEPIAEGEFASGDDSPPQWVLVAVSQMTEELTIDPASGLGGSLLDKEQVR